MRVLWLCNIMPPVIAAALKLPSSNKEGWISGLLEEWKRHGADGGMELGICFPLTPRSIQDKVRNELPSEGDIPIAGETEGISFYGFYEDTVRPECYDINLEKQLNHILKRFDPDLVHIFGTEYPHALAMARCMQDKSRLLVGLQGLCFKYADYYMADLPKWVQKRFLLRDILKWDNLRIQQNKYIRRGKAERETLQNVGHVTGRTDWDKQAATEVNPKVRYHFLNETLRPEFYGPKWDIDNCERNTIFLSQGNYPIKGLHYLLWALPEIKQQIPDVKVYVAGDEITRYGTLMEKIKIGSYGSYCRKLIRKSGLQEQVVFLGRLDAAAMCDRFLKCQVFLSPSAIENSPNSVGEAMLLGMPVVSSSEGGVSSMLKDGKEGLLYPYQDIGALTEAVCRMLQDEAFAIDCGRRAAAHAAETHDGEQNYRQLLEIYKEICEGENGCE